MIPLALASSVTCDLLVTFHLALTRCARVSYVSTARAARSLCSIATSIFDDGVDDVTAGYIRGFYVRAVPTVI